VQIYRLIKEWTAWDIARRAAFAFFGIFSGTEENPEFMHSMTYFSKKKKKKKEERNIRGSSFKNIIPEIKIRYKN
jgi:hypothetical protein